MKHISSKQLRQLWVSYWVLKRNHKLVQPCSLVGKDDSLLWVNSGIACLKQFFLSPDTAVATRIFNIQRAVRTDDLDLIGKTNRHLSFFEMMGNFSLGDYGKKEAIVWAWEFLTSKDWLNLDKSKIYITVFQDDQESINVCQQFLQVSVQNSNLFLKGKKTNFWDLGVGPCGPNLEFFYDLGPQLEKQPKKAGTLLLQQDVENDRFLEIWNIVFSEFFNNTKNFSPNYLEKSKGIYPSLEGKNYLNLPRKNIDTGMGLERILTVLQRKESCFETDLFQDIFIFLADKLQEFKITISPPLSSNPQLRIIADHLRAVYFMLSDLIQSDKSWSFQNKHAYIVRKIIRNAFLTAYFLGFKKPFLFLGIAVVADKNLSTIQPMAQLISQIQNLVLDEEKSFLFLLERVNYFLKTTHLDGATIFKLVTEEGLPFVLLKQIAQVKNISFGQKEYEQICHLEKKKQMLKNKKSQIWFDKTDVKKLSLGIDLKTIFQEKVLQSLDSKILVIITVQNTEQLTITNNLSAGQQGWIVVDKTPFYAQKGGQESDQGWFSNSDVAGTVSNVVVNDWFQHLHFVQVTKGQLKVGKQINLTVDAKKHQLATNNHSATHLLLAALRKILGEEVYQCGSLNNSQYLRLDFYSQNPELLDSFTLLKQVEELVNQKIQENIQPQVSFVTPEQAQKMQALDFFNVSQYYPEKVRVVNFVNYSVELCGGTHVTKTKQIENFLITSIKKIGKNHFRIYAVTTWEKTTTVVEKKQLLFCQKLEQNSELKNTFLTVSGVKDSLKVITDCSFYLEREYLQKQFWLKMEMFQKKQETQLLNQLLSIYSLPASDHHSLSGISFIYHCLNLEDNLDQKQLNYFRKQKHFSVLIPSSFTSLTTGFSLDAFFWKLFDKFKKTEKDFVFFFQNRQKVGCNFVLQFNESALTVDWWKKILSTEQVQFGVKKNKIQGFFKTSAEKFLSFLKSKIKEKD